MLYLDTIKETFLDFPDDESLAVIAFFEGCSHNCLNCHNVNLQLRHENKAITWELASNLIIDRCSRNKTNKVVLSGGDPFYGLLCKNEPSILQLITSLEKNSCDVCVYTGFQIYQIEQAYQKHSSETKPLYLKCGTFKENLRQLPSGKFNDRFILASSNQDFYKRSLENSFSKISEKGILLF